MTHLSARPACGVLPEWDLFLVARGERRAIDERYGSLPAVIVAAEDGAIYRAFGSASTPDVFAFVDGVVRAHGLANRGAHLETMTLEIAPAVSSHRAAAHV